MALDSIVELAGRVVFQVVADYLFGKVFYWPGWIVLRTLTLGRYPPPRSQPHNRGFVAAFGFALLVVLIGGYFSARFL